MKIRLAALFAATAVAFAGTNAYAEEPLVTKSGTIGEPKAGTGQIIFFRPGSFVGGALGCTVHEDDKEVARLGSGKYYVISASPGKHQYFTKGEATDRLNLEIEDGETYFVKCNIGMGVVAGRANLSPADRDAFAAKAKGLKLWAGGEKQEKDDK